MFDCLKYLGLKYYSVQKKFDIFLTFFMVPVITTVVFVHRDLCARELVQNLASLCTTKAMRCERKH